MITQGFDMSAWKYILIPISLLTSHYLYAAQPDQASMLANACAACHGPNGSSQGPATPSIAEISHDYFIDSMIAFKEGSRPSTVMQRIARGYTEQQILQMAAFFSKQKMQRTQQDFDAELAKAGKAIHEEQCEKCHAEEGRLSEDDSGILAGQKMPYLRYTLEDIINEKRDVSRKMLKRLRHIHKQAGNKSFEQLIHYYGSLQ